jgi:hypothetical protein
VKEVSWPASTIRWVGRYGGLLKSAVTEQELLAVLQRPRIAPKVEPAFFDRVRRMQTAAEPFDCAAEGWTGRVGPMRTRMRSMTSPR